MDILFRIFHLLILIFGASGLSDVQIKVPLMVRSGDSAILTCNYNLDVELYTIKWYLDSHEFYRFTPSDSHKSQSFNVRDLTIDHAQSNAQDVRLLELHKDHSGVYKCEVTEDHPRYETKWNESSMLVVDVPEKKPTIEKHQFAAGETLKVSCTSDSSWPPTELTWTLNGVPLEKTLAQYDLRNVTTSKPLYKKSKTRAQSILEIKIKSNLFERGRLRLRCFASIGDIYRASAEYEVADDAPLLASITGDASPHSHHSNGCSRSARFELITTSVTAVILHFLLAATAPR